MSVQNKLWNRFLTLCRQKELGGKFTMRKLGSSHFLDQF